MPNEHPNGWMGGPRSALFSRAGVYDEDYVRKTRTHTPSTNVFEDLSVTECFTLYRTLHSTSSQPEAAVLPGVACAKEVMTLADLACTPNE